MLGTHGIGVALEWLSNHDDIHACERRPRLTLTTETAQLGCLEPQLCHPSLQVKQDLNQDTVPG